MAFETKDSGERQKFSTGAQRDTQAGKGRYDLLPYIVIKRDAELYERGAQKYDDNNWKRGIPLTRLADSALRHTFKAFNGEEDEDHLAHARWNLAAYMWTLEEIRAGRLPAELAAGTPYALEGA